MKEDVFCIECNKLLGDLFDILEVELEELTEQEKELIIAYSFGMISVMAEENQVNEQVKCSIFEKIIKEVFKYSKEEAKSILQKLIDSIQTDSNEVLKIMIHQGKYIYPKYKLKNYNEIYDRLTNMIDVIVSGEYKNY